MLELLISLQNLPIALVARAEVFMSEEQAAHLIFPNKIMAPKTTELSPDQIKIIEKKSNETVRQKKVKFFISPTGEMVVIDQVLGKHEFITYAVGIEPSGKVKQIEILEYKETYGLEIKRESWLKQFYGKNKEAPFKLNEDIKNIGGATLSSKHLTDGVRRIMNTYEFIRS